MDYNKDGVVTKDEFKRFLNEGGLDVTSEYLENYIKKYDYNGDGIVEFDEYVKFETAPKLVKSTIGL